MPTFWACSKTAAKINAGAGSRPRPWPRPRSRLSPVSDGFGRSAWRLHEPMCPPSAPPPSLVVSNSPSGSIRPASASTSVPNATDQHENLSQPHNDSLATVESLFVAAAALAKRPGRCLRTDCSMKEFHHHRPASSFRHPAPLIVPIRQGPSQWSHTRGLFLPASGSCGSAHLQLASQSPLQRTQKIKRLDQPSKSANTVLDLRHQTSILTTATVRDLSTPPASLLTSPLAVPIVP